MSGLDRLIPMPRLLEVDHVDLALPVERAWQILRHDNLARRSGLVRGLFALRTLPDQIVGKAIVEPTLCVDDLRSTAEQPGFQVLLDRPPRELVVGAIGKVWKLEIPFVHVRDAEAYAAFEEPDFVKVAWAIRCEPRGADTRVSIEVRVDATDDAAWRKFRRYFALIGPASRFIRATLLASLAREHGTPESRENERELPGDELLADATAQVTHAITIGAEPEAIWPWLVQMGGSRAGFYSLDVLDNAGARSAREVHPELQDVRVGDVLPATPRGRDGFEVLRVDAPRTLVLGGLFDSIAQKQVPFWTSRPESFWQVTWSFVLEPLDERTTRLHARARAAYSASDAFHATWIRPVHHWMQRAQLEGLAARAEGRLDRDDWRDVAEGVGGAAIMAAAFLTPFLAGARSHWGVDADTVARAFPGDDRVPTPRWQWTHGIEIDAPAERVWPWVAQIGAGRGGFYSYQWLENVAGCDLRNAETVHPEWEIREDGGLSLHPQMPPLRVVEHRRGSHFVVYAPADDEARAEGRPWVEASWGFFVEPLGERRCRVISRYRCASSGDRATRLRFGRAAIEPIGFAMDRRMLIGIKERAERLEPALAKARATATREGLEVR